jgi:hypothetical protein
LIPYYQEQGLLHSVPAGGGIEQVYANIIGAVGPQAGSSC